MSASGFLLHLLRKGERRESSADFQFVTLTPQNAPDYCRPASVDIEDDFERALVAAERSGSVQLRRRRDGRLDAARIHSLPLLAEHLGRQPAAARAAAVADDVLAAATTPALLELAKFILGRWQIGEKWFGLGVEDAAALATSFTLAGAVQAGRSDGLDMRSFSARVAGDSKFLENNSALFARVYRAADPRPELAELGADDLLEHLDLQKHPPVLTFRGDVLLTSGLRTGYARHFIALPPDDCEISSLCTRPSAVLSIENLAAFNNHVRRVPDDALVLYTGGFPSRHLLRFYERLDDLLPERVPFFHWGDIDEGGVRIFTYLASRLRRPLNPHLMSAAVLEQYGVAGKRPRPWPAVHPAVRTAYELAGSRGLWLEQERLEPIPCQAATGST